jgi:hypothetical protein
MSREALMGSARSMQRFYAASYLLSINAVETPPARVEVSRAAFRITHFPGMDDLEAAGELGAWARRNGVGVDFAERKIRIGGREHEVLYVLFAAG